MLGRNSPSFVDRKETLIVFWNKVFDHFVYEDLVNFLSFTQAELWRRRD